MYDDNEWILGFLAIVLFVVGVFLGTFVIGRPAGQRATMKALGYSQVEGNVYMHKETETVVKIVGEEATIVSKPTTVEDLAGDLKKKALKYFKEE